VLQSCKRAEEFLSLARRRGHPQATLFRPGRPGLANL
jgi:hypothetical protein